MRRSIALVSAVTLAASPAGCSFSIGEPPEPPHAVYPHCESSYAKPVLDVAGTALGGLLMLGSLAAAGISESEEDQTGTLLVLLALTGAMTVTFGVAAVGGIRKVRGCREEQSSHRPRARKRRRRDRLPVGTERAACLGGGRCHDGLTCASDRCVRLPPEHPPDAGSPAPWEPDAGPQADAAPE